MGDLAPRDLCVPDRNHQLHLSKDFHEEEVGELNFSKSQDVTAETFCECCKRWCGNEKRICSGRNGDIGELRD
jgi:hypothetical protein